MQNLNALKMRLIQSPDVYTMKVKDVIEFLSKCNPNAEFISEDHNGYNHALDELYFGRCISSDKESGMPVSSDCVYAVFKDESFK